MRTLLDPSTDKKRSNPFAKSKQYLDHRAAETVMALRAHALGSTQKKRAEMANFIGLYKTPNYVSYYRAMYPSPRCYHCSLGGGPVLVEDTAHVIACSSCPAAEEIKTSLWDRIWQKVAEKTAANPHSLPARTLYPFGCSSPAQRAASTAAITAIDPQANAPASRQLQYYSAALGNMGLIPSSLPEALHEIGVHPSQSADLATYIAEELHRSVHACCITRAKVRAEGLDQKALYREHVLGIHPPQPVAPVGPP